MSDALLQSLINGLNLPEIFPILIKSVLVACIICYAQFLWGRRKLYIYSRNVQGPFSLPFIGSAYYFLGNTADIFKGLMSIFHDYPGLSRMWYGHRLIYFAAIPEYIRIILNHPKALAKDDWYKYAEPSVGKGLFTAPVSQWKTHRKIIFPSFNKKILDNFVETFAEQSKILVDQLKKYSGKGEMDIYHVVSKCTLDIICETAMGIKINAQTTHSQFSEMIEMGAEIIFRRMFVFWYNFDFIFNLTRYAKELNDAVNYTSALTSKIVNEKRMSFKRKMDKNSIEAVTIDEGNKRKAFLDYLLEKSTQEGKIFTDTELIDEVNTFMIAGSDTTSSSISFVFIILGMYPDVQKKVYEEIINVLGPDRNVQASDLSHLKYLECVIKETLRLFPVGAIIVRAIEEDIDLKDGNTLPEGSSVIIGILDIHRSQKYWPDPLKFNPDRFLPEEVAKRHPCCYIPFSYGPRNCIGINYGIMVMKSIITTVVRSYKINTNYKNIENIELKMNVMLRPKDGFLLSLEERNLTQTQI